MRNTNLERMDTGRSASAERHQQQHQQQQEQQHQQLRHHLQVPDGVPLVPATPGKAAPPMRTAWSPVPPLQQQHQQQHQQQQQEKLHRELEMSWIYYNGRCGKSREDMLAAGMSEPAWETTSNISLLELHQQQQQVQRMLQQQQQQQHQQPQEPQQQQQQQQQPRQHDWKNDPEFRIDATRWTFIGRQPKRAPPDGMIWHSIGHRIVGNWHEGHFQQRPATTPAAAAATSAPALAIADADQGADRYTVTYHYFDADQSSSGSSRSSRSRRSRSRSRDC